MTRGLARITERRAQCCAVACGHIADQEESARRSALTQVATCSDADGNNYGHIAPTTRLQQPSAYAASLDATGLTASDQIGTGRDMR